MLKHGSNITNVTTNNNRGTQGLIDLQLVLVVEASRVSGIAHDEAGAVIVHAPFTPAHEKVPRLAQRACAVHERGAHRGAAVTRGRTQRELVGATPHTANDTWG